MCVSAHSRVRALSLLVPGGEVLALFHQHVESPGLEAVADLQQYLPAHPGVTIVTSLTVHAHHAVYTALWREKHTTTENDMEQGGR